MYYVRIYIYIYIRQHQSLYSCGDGIKNESEMHASSLWTFFQVIVPLQLIDGVSP